MITYIPEILSEGLDSSKNKYRSRSYLTATPIALVFLHQSSDQQRLHHSHYPLARVISTLGGQSYLVLASGYPATSHDAGLRLGDVSRGCSNVSGACIAMGREYNGVVCPYCQ